MKNEKCRSMPRVVRIGSKIVMGVFIAVGFAFIFGYFVMLLWNWLMPDIFSLQEVSYWQAFGIVLLGRLLFGSSGDHEGHDSHHQKLSNRRFGMNTGHDPECYDTWWEAEGKASFDEYIGKKRGEDVERKP